MRLAHHDKKAGPTEQLLAAVPLFSRLAEREIHRIGDLMTRLDVAAGTPITHEGHTGREFIIILEGTATVTVDGEQVATVGPGDFQGEISLLDGGPRTATVVADTPMRLMVASRDEFVELLDEHPVIARKMLPALAHRIRAISDAHHTH
jgi:CRP/FNR family transcriptional regulator, cyclic AMP receptor protein